MDGTDVLFQPLHNVKFNTSENFPRFLVLQSKNKETPVTCKSVFLIAKFIEGVWCELQIKEALIK